MKRILILAAITLSLAGVRAVSAKELAVPFESSAFIQPQSQIDQLVFAKLKDLKVEPANLCSDEVFLRRVYLDVIGTLPTPEQAKEFLDDVDPKKRRILVDQLLERDEFAEYWAMKWCDILRVKAEFPINLWPNAVQTYHRWILNSLKQNKPYDQFARELLTSNGSNFRVPPVNFYRAVQNKTPQGIAQTVALTFMGERTANWPSNRLNGMAGFFSQLGYKSTLEWKEEIVYFDSSKDTNGLSKTAIFPDGTKANLEPGRDPREVFADWLISPQNPWFTRNIANRVWSWLMGRGIIQEPDDIRPDNPPSNPELLAFLQSKLIADHYDLKKLFRLILNSTTYQLSSVPKGDSSKGDANFSHYPLRRIEAEVLADALNQITDSTERYNSPIPEPFTYIPESVRSISLADGSITSSFLEMFGRPARDTGLENERNNKATPSQRLHLLNSTHIQSKIEKSPKIQALLRKETPRDTVDGVYLLILSRKATDTEFNRFSTYAQSGVANRREAVLDLAWALINSAEFLYRH